MIYVTTILMAVAMVAGFLGIYELGLSMQLGFTVFWTLIGAAVIALAVDVAQHRRRHFLE